MSVTLEALIQAIARETSDGRWPVVRLATGGSVSTVVDTRLINDATGADDQAYKDAWLRLVRKESNTSSGIGATTLTRATAAWTVDYWKGATFTVWEDGHLHVFTVTSNTATIATGTWDSQPVGTALAYEAQCEYIRKIKTFDPATGTLTIVGGNFATAAAAGEEYEIHFLTHPDNEKESINDALNEMEYEEVLPLTLITDGDMEADGSTGWTATNATLAKNRSNVQIGRQSQAVLASAANGVSKSGSVAVTPGEMLIVAAPVYGDKQQAELVLYDVTNAADIETARHDEEGWALLAFTATVPADCYEVAAWLRTKTNGGTTFWDFVTLLKAKDGTYAAPSWVATAGDFLKLAHLPLGPALSSDNAKNAYAMWSEPLAHVHTFGTIQAQRGVIPLRLQMGQKPPPYPVLVIGKRNYPSLTLDVDTTEADKETVVAGGLYHLYRRLGSDYGKLVDYWGQKYARLRRKYEGTPNVKLVSTYGAGA